jgi:anti-sigma B factor antagonist
MRISERIDGKIAILAISGKLMGGPDNYILKEKVESLISEGIKNVVIDLSHVRWMNSPGLGILIGCRKLLDDAHGGLRIANATDKVNNLLVMTHVIEFVGNYSSVQRAVYSPGWNQNLQTH